MENLTKRLHILMLPSWYLPNGGQFCRNQAQILCEKGIKANILANVSISLRKYKLKAFVFPWKYFTSHEDKLIVFRFFSRSIPYLKRINGILWSWQTVVLFRKYCKIYGKPDIIHVHSVLWGGYAAYLINKKTGIPYIITEHKGIFGLSCEYAKNQFEDWQTPFMKKAFSNARVIVPVSTNLKLKIQTYLNKNVLIKPISNVVDTDFFYYKKRSVENDIKFVCVNGFMYVKAYDILIPAFDKVCDKVSNVKLRIVGEDFEGEEFNKLWSSVKHKDKITFTGELDMHGVRDELWAANVFIISSRVESQSVSTMEALSTGLPVVCTTVIPHEIVNESNSIVVPVENKIALTEAIIEMSDKFTTYNGASISVQIKKTSGKEVVTKKLIDLYSLILE
jgi:glycosyltransferase involved in cell wall biosynthesis